MKIKGIALVLLLSFMLGCIGCGNVETQSYDVVTTIFPAYDFARAVMGESSGIKQLLPPGAESHSYELSARDIIAIQKCKLFICVGGESEQWVDSILESMENPPKVIRMIDCVDVLDEEIKEGMEHEHEEHAHDEDKYDEHVWTSPKNAVTIIEKICEALIEAYPGRADEMSANSAKYCAEINALDSRFEELFSGHDGLCLILGDRFPLRYFVERYGIDYYAAFPGCSADSEVSASTVAFLINKIKEIGAPTVFHIEFSNHVIADSIAESIGAGIAQFNTCHNVSKKQLDEGATYLSLMEENYRTMEKYIAESDK